MRWKRAIGRRGGTGGDGGGDGGGRATGIGMFAGGN